MAFQVVLLQVASLAFLGPSEEGLPKLVLIIDEKLAQPSELLLPEVVASS